MQVSGTLLRNSHAVPRPTVSSQLVNRDDEDDSGNGTIACSDRILLRSSSGRSSLLKGPLHPDVPDDEKNTWKARQAPPSCPPSSSPSSSPRRLAHHPRLPHDEKTRTQRDEDDAEESSVWWRTMPPTTCQRISCATRSESVTTTVAEDSSLSSSSCSSSLSSRSSCLVACDSPQAKVPRRRVSFHRMEIREYRITVGDHPLCRDGLPLTLDWQHGRSRIFDISDDSNARRGRTFDGEDGNDGGPIRTPNDIIVVRPEDSSLHNLDAGEGQDPTAAAGTVHATIPVAITMRERTHRYRMPRRLSYGEKRERLGLTASSFDCDDNDDVSSLSSSSSSLSSWSTTEITSTRHEELGRVIARMQSWWHTHPVLPMPRSLCDIDEHTVSNEEEDDEEEEEDEEIGGNDGSRGSTVSCTEDEDSDSQDGSGDERKVPDHGRRRSKDDPYFVRYENDGPTERHAPSHPRIENEYVMEWRRNL